MGNLINYIHIIEVALSRFDYVVLDVRDCIGKMYQIRFDSTQDVIEKCEHMANVLGDGNIVLNMKCRNNIK